MNKILSLLFLGFGLMFFSSCDKKDGPNGQHVIPESPFLFTVISSSNPNTKIYYESPDPGCGIPKDYDIYTDLEASELVLECTNRDEIYIDYKKSYFGDVILEIENESKEWIYIKDKKLLVIKFPNIPENETFDVNNTITILYLYADTPEGQVFDSVCLYRVPELW